MTVTNKHRARINVSESPCRALSRGLPGGGQLALAIHCAWRIGLRPAGVRGALGAGCTSAGPPSAGRSTTRCRSADGLGWSLRCRSAATNWIARRPAKARLTTVRKTRIRAFTMATHYLWATGLAEEGAMQDRRTCSYNVYSYASLRLDLGTGRIGQCP